LNILRELVVTTGKLSRYADQEGGVASLPGQIEKLSTTAMIGVMLTQVVFGDKNVIHID
jgi:hypothetical protein